MRMPQGTITLGLFANLIFLLEIEQNIRVLDVNQWVRGSRHHGHKNQLVEVSWDHAYVWFQPENFMPI